MVDSKIASLPSDQKGTNQHTSLMQLKNDALSGTSISAIQFPKAMEIDKK